MNLRCPSVYAPLQGWSEKEVRLLQTIESHGNLGRAPYVFCMLSSLACTDSDAKDDQLRTVCTRIWSKIPTGVAHIVQVASTIAAIEEEDYHNVPSRSLGGESLRYFLSNMTGHYKHLSNAHMATDFQKKRYAELKRHPRLVTQVTHGLSRKLVMSDRDDFVRELLAAGRRECHRADEQSAPDEKDVLHVAMSYKHVDRYDGSGTIDVETAEEVHALIYLIHFVTPDTQVRVWIDQNLHRYNDSVPWYEKGFVPYAVMDVVSALSKYGGFAIGQTRPWIWVETGLAAFGGGMVCKKENVPTLEAVLAHPGESPMDAVRIQNRTLRGSSLYSTILRCLLAVSLWTPAILQHASYECIAEFWKFVLWARAQVVRFSRKCDFDLCHDSFEDSMIERIAWMKALPDLQGTDNFRMNTFMRIELDATQANEFLSLLKVTGDSVIQDDNIEMLGISTLQKFCFKESGSTVSLNVPSKVDRSYKKGTEMVGLDEDIMALRTNQGGYSRWDIRFDGRAPKLVRCGSIFDRPYSMAHLIGTLGATVRVGGERFDAIGFSVRGIANRMERVYKAVAADVDVLLCETDVLCLQQLDDGLQQKVIDDLWPNVAYPAMRRLLAVSDDVAVIEIQPSMVCVDGKLALVNRESLASRRGLGRDEVIVKRIRISVSGADRRGVFFALLLVANRYGDVTTTFTVDESVDTTVMMRAAHGQTAHDTLTLRTYGNAMLAMMKIRLMMGSTEFRVFSPEGLRFALGVHCEGTMRFPWVLKLDGNEFQLCEDCSNVFSPINSRIGSVACMQPSRKTVVEWLGLHTCRSGTSRPCGFTGVIG